MLPLLEWCDIPAGTVTITYKFSQGVVDHALQYRTEERLFEVESFRIGKYPITNAQYQLFVSSQRGFLNKQWWESSSLAMQWHMQHLQPSDPYFPGDEIPCNHVCWYDAIAFCRWLADETQLPIRLPNEQQWQRAGQGDDNRTYPWGSNFDSERCNGNNEFGGPTPVGYFPTGVSPFGVYDMVGNIGEWCLTEYYHGSNDDLSTDSMRVYRGGSFNLGHNGLRLDERHGAVPDSEIGLVGFRIVALPQW